MAPFEKTNADEDGPKSLAPSTEPYLFLVLECGRPLAGGVRLALHDTDEVLIGRGAERGFTRVTEEGRRRLRIKVPDARMSGAHARITRAAGGRWELHDCGSTNGTLVGGRKVTSCEVGGDNLVEIGSTLFSLRSRLTFGAPSDLDRAVAGRPGLATLVPEYTEALSALARVAPSSVPVLLLGESGTGKEVLARAVHAMSLRAGAFVPVNCGGLPETLIEGQLFGHVRGAFSGAERDEPGLVRASDKGTLFLDEIGDMPRSSQVALLRVLQEREVMPVGSTRATKVDLRVLAATHRRVDASGGDGGFRADLYARLAGFTHRLLPLRERREDLGVLIAELLGAIAPDRAARLTLSPALGRALFHYAFPLNIRELHQCLSVASVLATGDVIELKHASEPIRGAQAEPRDSSRAAQSAPAKVEALRASGESAVARSAPALSEEDLRIRSELVLALETHKGNVSEVARVLGRTRMQIHRWMKRFGVEVSAFRS